MKRLLLVMALLAAVAAVGNPVIDACGTKYLLGARSARYQRLQITTHPAKILWYFQEDENAPEEERWDPENLEPLLKAGHTIERARDVDELRSALRLESFDIVIIEIGEARELSGIVEGVSPDSVLLRTMEFPTRPEYARAKREFGNVLKFPTTIDGVLSALDKAQRARGM